MRDQVLRYIRGGGLTKPGDRVLVAVSGGADSVALLRVLLELQTELGTVLAVAHFNHGLRGEDSDADEHFVADLATRHELPFFVDSVRVAEHAAAQRMSLEAAGRELRYEWLAKVAAEHRFDSVATAHSRDDQAETVLMKFLRGAGSRGLAGIYPVMIRGEGSSRFVRPLLSTTRAEIEIYLESLQQDWREDDSNLDRRFFRNRVRHELLPLLERDYNPSIREVLSDRADINRDEEDYWGEVVDSALRRIMAGPQQLRISGLTGFPVALQRRVLKSFLESRGVACDSQHVEAVRRVALGELSRIELPGRHVAWREADCLAIQRQNDQPPTAAYSYEMSVPGEVELAEIHCALQILPVPASLAEEADPGTLLRAERMGDRVCIRNWQAGDRYHLAYQGKEHKLKTLFLQRKIPASDRPLWPVMLKGEDVVWVRGLPVADAYCWRPGDGDALSVQCITRP